MLLIGVTWFAKRGTWEPRRSDEPEAATRTSALPPQPHPLTATPESQRTPTPSAAEAPSAPSETTPATISGRLVIDEYAPSKGRVHLQTADGAWERRIGIDPWGRFYLEGVPPTELLLAFEADGLFERQLVLPNLFAVHPAPGELHFVDLNWTTRHLNVQVAEPDLIAAPLEVELIGPNYRTRFLTNERGKARLSLVGSGNFTLRTVLPTGVRVEASEELAEEGELETIVIANR